MAAPDQGEQFLRLARDKGLLSPEQVKECVRVSVQLEQLGLPESIPEIAVKKGFLQAGQKDALLKELAHEDETFAFEIGEEIGQGTIGIVYRARQKRMDRQVALKILKPEFAQDAALVEQFLKEARSSAKFNHVNVVQGLDAGPYKGTYYFAMELVDGPPLDEILAKRKKLRINEAISIAIQIARALEYAEKAGVVHRDIKPDNILVTKDGTAKLCDLGMARLGVSDDAIKSGIAVGTPYYMSPEQARGSSDVDIRSDIYSLGATMYHMLTGDPPFKGLSVQDVLRSQLTETIPDPRTKNPEVSAPLAAIIAKMMAKDPKHRYHHAKEVQRDLELYAADKPLQFAVEPPADSTVALKRDVRQVARKTLPYVLVGAGAVVVASVVIFILVNPLGESAPPPPLPLPAARPPDLHTDKAPGPQNDVPAQPLDKQKQLYDSVLELIAEHPNDEQGNIERLKNAAPLLKGSPYEKLVQERLDEIVARRETARREKLDRIRSLVDPLIAAADIDAARSKVSQLIPREVTDDDLVKLREALYQAINNKVVEIWKPFGDAIQKAVDEKKFAEARRVVSDCSAHKLSQIRDRAAIALKKVEEAEAAENKRLGEEARRRAEERKAAVEAARASLATRVAAAFVKRDFDTLRSTIDAARVEYPELEQFLDSCAKLPAEVQQTIKAATEAVAARTDTVSVTWKGQQVRGKVSGRDGPTIFITTSQGMKLPVKIEDAELADILLLAGVPDPASRETYLTAAAVAAAYGDAERARKYLEKIPDNTDAAVLVALLNAASAASANEAILSLLAKGDAAFQAKNWVQAEDLFRKAVADHADTDIVKERIAEISEKVYRCFALGEDPWAGIYKAWVAVTGPARLRLTYDFARNRTHADEWSSQNSRVRPENNGLEIVSDSDKECRFANEAYLRNISFFWVEGRFQETGEKSWMGLITGQLFWRFWLGGGGAVWNISKPEDWHDEARRKQFASPPVKDADLRLTVKISGGKAAVFRDDKEAAAIPYNGPSLPAMLNFNGRFVLSKAVIEGTVDPVTIKELILRNHLPGAKGVDNGLKAQFYSSRKFDKPSVQVVLPNLSFRFPDEPAAETPRDGFSIRITGNLLVPEDGDYVFYCQGNGTFRLVLQGRIVLMRVGGADAESKPVRLKRGVFPVVAEYIDDDGESVNRLQWSGPDMERRPLSNTVFLQSR